MPDLDQDIVVSFTYRVAEVAIVWAVILFGSIVRHEMRRSGWSSRAVRATTAVMWLVTLVAAGRLLLPTTNLVWRSLSPIVLNVFLLLLVAVMFLSERARLFVAVRPARRMALVREVHRIYTRLNDVDVDLTDNEQRAEIDRDLAELDRWVGPDTFEYVQLARSRVVSGLDGGPRAMDRERRWSTRMNELQTELVAPPRADRLSAVGEAIRRPILAGSPWIAAASGALLGRSVLVGPTWVIVPVLILLGYLGTWRWDRIELPGVVAFGAALATTAIVATNARWGTALFTVVVLEAVVVAASFGLWRSRAVSRPRLTVLSGDREEGGTGGDDAGGPGRAG